MSDVRGVGQHQQQRHHPHQRQQQPSRRPGVRREQELPVPEDVVDMVNNKVNMEVMVDMVDSYGQNKYNCITDTDTHMVFEDKMNETSKRRKNE